MVQPSQNEDGFMFGFWIRREACRLAAQAMNGQCNEGDVGRRLWALAIFFEQYMRGGAEGTLADFGYKEPVKLGAVE